MPGGEEKFRYTSPYRDPSRDASHHGKDMLARMLFTSPGIVLVRGRVIKTRCFSSKAQRFFPPQGTAFAIGGACFPTWTLPQWLGFPLFFLSA